MKAFQTARELTNDRRRFAAREPHFLAIPQHPGRCVSAPLRPALARSIFRRLRMGFVQSRFPSRSRNSSAQFCTTRIIGLASGSVPTGAGMMKRCPSAEMSYWG